MQEVKFIDSYYDKETGVSEVTIEYDGLIFIGESMLREGDTPNEFTGGRMAQIKALIKAAKYKYAKINDEYKIVLNLVKSCTNCKNFDKESPTAKVLFRQLNIKSKQVAAAKQNVEHLKELFSNSIKYQEDAKARKTGERD